MAGNHRIDCVEKQPVLMSTGAFTIGEFNARSNCLENYLALILMQAIQTIPDPWRTSNISI
jgi:sialic acid synthase SpsE